MFQKIRHIFSEAQLQMIQVLVVFSPIEVALGEVSNLASFSRDQISALLRVQQCLLECSLTEDCDQTFLLSIATACLVAIIVLKFRKIAAMMRGIMIINRFLKGNILLKADLQYYPKEGAPQSIVKYSS
mgnify:CR=1 FL=1